MGILRRASAETKRIPLTEDGPVLDREPADGEDWVEVRTDIAKRDFNRFIAFMPSRSVSEETGMTAVEATELQKGLFETLVTGWSLDAPATVAEYEGLSNEGASAIDTALAEHFKSLQPSKQEEKAGFRPK